MSRKNKKTGVPDRWLDYRAVGERIPGTRFIAFKVPLKQSLNCNLPSSDVFGPWELLDALGKEKQELGLIIDLTFTTRYYKLEDIPNSLLCVKILTAGHNIPSDATILSFKRAVRKFLRDNTDNDKLIGVHCTHGLNRTGYLVCRYLIDVDGMDPKRAIGLFNASRGHTIERENYLKDLQFGHKRSNNGMEEPEQEPVRGSAVRRPHSSHFGRDLREEGQHHRHDHHSRGPVLQRELSHMSNYWDPRAGHHSAYLRPNPPPMPRASHSQYQWNQPHPSTQWTRPFSSEPTRYRYPAPECRSYRERSSHYASAPPDAGLSRYSSNEFWTGEPSGRKSSEKRTGQKGQTQRRNRDEYRDDY